MPDIAAARPVAGQPIETAWGQQVHDAIEGLAAVLTGTDSVTAATFTGSFSRAFAAPPTIVATVNQGAGVITVTASRTTTEYTFEVQNNDGSTPGGCLVHWIAIGTFA